MPSAYPSRPSPDVLVIGAGIVGASIAWRLAQRGLRVTLADAGVFGGEASSAGAGMLAPDAEFIRPNTWAEMAAESLRMYPGFVAELESESGRSIDYRQCGSVEIAETELEFQRFADRLEHRSALRPASASVLLTSSQVREAAPRVRGTGIAGGLYHAGDAIVDPSDVLAALRSACLNHGILLLESHAVSSIQVREDQVSVHTGGEALTSRTAVLAAGAWSSQIQVTGNGIPLALTKSFPVKGHLIGFDLPPQWLGPVVRHGHTYILQRSSGFTVAGSTEERLGFDRSLDDRLVEDIRNRAGRLIPELREITPSRTWVGLRPATDGLQPEVGRLGESNLWVAYGHYRNGILLAPATAARLDAEITSSLETR